MPRPTAHDLHDRRLFGWTLLACVLLCGAMAAPFFAGRVYVSDDLGAYHLPLRNFYANQLRQGEPFDWLPDMYNGFYLAGEGQVGTYHPLHLLLYRLFPVGTAFDLELLLSYPLMLAGTYWLFKRRLQRGAVALFGSLVFSFSSFNLLHFVHPNAIEVVAHLPWLLLLIDVLITTSNRRSRWLACAGISLLTASQLLLGYPQYIWFSLLAEAAYAISRSKAAYLRPWRAALLLVGSLAIGALAGGLQWLPTADALLHSTRAEASAEFANSGSLHPLNFVQLVAPYLFKQRVVGQNTHELGLYLGAVPLVLIVWLFARRADWGRWRPLIVGTSIFGVLCLLLALGEHGPIYRVQQWLPFVNRFRFPCRSIVLVELACAALSSMALLLVHTRRASAPHEPRPTILWILLLASAAVAIIAPLVWPAYTAEPVLCWAGPALIALAAALLFTAERSVEPRTKTAAILGLVFLTAADLGVYGLSYAVWPGTMSLKAFAQQQSLPPERSLPVVVETARDRAAHQHVGNRLLLVGVRRADGYAGLEPSRRLDYSRVEALQLAGVGWRAADRYTNGIAASESTDVGPSEWQPVPTPLPRVRLVTHALVDTGSGPIPAAALRADTALTEEPIELDASDPGSVQIMRQGAGYYEITAHAPGRQLLVVAESFHPGWIADVDGDEVPVVRVNRDFLGCVVPAGEHQVALHFRPASLRYGAVCSSLGLGLMVGLLVVALLPGARPARLRSLETFLPSRLNAS